MNNSLIKKLNKLLGSRCCTDDKSLEDHSRDKSSYAPVMPIAICYPTDEQEISIIVQLANDYKVAITPYGAGTSIEAQAIPSQGAISLDMALMNKIVKLLEDDLTCIVQPGLRKNELNQFLESKRLFFPAGPLIDASFGGMASTCASGINAVKYGTIRDNILSLKFIDPKGNLIKTGQLARKSAAGYDLTNLLIGAEGTLGIITELTLKLTPMPKDILNAYATFPSLDNAVKAVIEVLKMNLKPAAIELLDELQIQAVNRYSGIELKEAASLFVELHGSSAQNQADISIIENVFKRYDACDFSTAVSKEDRKSLWQARADCYYAARNLSPESDALTTDVCVPISKLTECIRETKKDIENSSIIAPLLGHVGDGNFHMVLLINKQNDLSREEALWINDRLINRAIRMGGTCTGEHGIGIGKKAYLIKEKGADTVSAMAAIKKAWDPNNIMNPGKVFD